MALPYLGAWDRAAGGRNIINQGDLGLLCPWSPFQAGEELWTSCV